MNSLSISQEHWEHARQCLIFYFSRRHGFTDAEDLAQQTLLALWQRQDFEFESEDDFLRVCYAFAKRVSQQGYRQNRRFAAVALDSSFQEPIQHTNHPRLEPAELKLLLDEVLRTKEQLTDKERALIDNAIASDLRQGSNARVYLHRARKKLERLTGWRKGTV